jgi:hypothetical protein
MFRGDTYVFQITVVQEPMTRGAGPTSQNVTGWLFWCTLKRTVSDPDQLAVAQVTSTPTSNPAGGGIVFLNAPAGIIQVTIPAIATRGFPDGVVRLVGDVQGKDTFGNIWTVERFELDVEPDVTSTIA